MSCNGKRDGFVLDDLLVAASAADVKNPKLIIKDVELATSHWNEHADRAGINEGSAKNIKQLFRGFL